MTSRRARSTITAVIVSVGMLVWIATPGVGLWALSTKSQAISLTSPVSTWVPVEQAQGELKRSTRIDLLWGEQAALHAPAWSGTVQTVHVRKGMTVKSGDAIVTVDGIVRQAWALSVPLYRPLSRDDTGSDAEAVNQLLSALGLPANPGNQIGRDSIAGIREFAARIGVPHAEDVVSFDPGWVIYLPAENAEISAVDAAPSVPAPMAGEPVLSFGTLLEQATLRSPAAEGEELYVAGQPLVVAEDGLSVDESSLPLLQTLLEPDASDVNGSLRIAANGEWTVPTAAVLAGDGGRFCVVVRDRGNESAESVELSGGEGGTAVVSGNLKEDDFVLVGPDLGEHRCKS